MLPAPGIPERSPEVARHPFLPFLVAKGAGSKRVRRKRGTVGQGSMCSVAEGYSYRRAKGKQGGSLP
jgi:hypothetical protein